tara:strand:+ start:37553 stop:37999 length:447 start_codon:yes stop_codon:yes gene_type:complete
VSNNASKTDPIKTSVKGRDGTQTYYMATDEFYPMKTPYLDFAYGIYEGFEGAESKESTPQPVPEGEIETSQPTETSVIDNISINDKDLDKVLPNSGTCHKMCPDVTCPKPVCPQPVCPKLDYTWLQANFVAVMILLIIIILIIIMSRR